MSEYWISTPKYWCKHCAVFVRDTKLEKANHEATGKHQGALKRFLRDLHRGNEREKRDAERAKSEVARLNGQSAPRGASASTANAGSAKPKVQASVGDRRRQMAQLEAMGVAIPEELRERASDSNGNGWTVVSERVVYEKADDEEVKEEEDDKDGMKTSRSVNVGVKRKIEDDEEEEYATAIPPWRKTKSLARMRVRDTGEDELDALLGGVGVGVGVKKEQVKVEAQGLESVEGEKIQVKKEPGGLEKVKDEADADDDFMPVFKKRKAKA